MNDEKDGFVSLALRIERALGYRDLQYDEELAELLDMAMHLLNDHDF